MKQVKEKPAIKITLKYQEEKEYDHNTIMWSLMPQDARKIPMEKGRKGNNR